MIAVKRSVIERPTRTAGRHIGSVRKRSMMPPLRSLLSPTAVPMAEVVKLSASMPGDRVLGVAAAVRYDDARAEHVDEERGEEHRLDRDVGELQRLARDVDEVAIGQ